MVAADGEDAEAAQEVKIAPTFEVVEIGTGRRCEVDVKADCLKHPDKLGIEILLVKLKLLSSPRRKKACDIDCHSDFRSLSSIGRSTGIEPGTAPLLLS